MRVSSSYKYHNITYAINQLSIILEMYVVYQGLINRLID